MAEGRSPLARGRVTVAVGGVVLVALGAAVFANPDRTLGLVTALLGWALVLVGACLAIEALLRRREQGSLAPRVAAGVCLAAFGALVAARPALFVSYVVALLGAVVLLTGVADCAEAAALRRMDHPFWRPAAAIGAVTCLMGALVLAAPFAFAQWATMVAGAALVADGVTEVVAALNSRD